jgi:Holliday junction resolvase
MVDARRKGYEWQRRVRQWMEAQGWKVQARPAGETGDDLTVHTGTRLLSVECKDVARPSVGAWVDQAERQRSLGGIPVVIWKRRGKGDVSDAYAIIPLRHLPGLMGDES